MKGKAERATDERDLMMLRLLASGVDRAEIADRTGMKRPYINAVLSRVSRADMDESGEPADRVRLAYLPPVKTQPRKLRGTFAGRY